MGKEEMPSMGHIPSTNHHSHGIRDRYHVQHENRSTNFAVFVTATITIVVSNLSFMKKVDLMTYTVFFCILAVVTIAFNIVIFLLLAFRYVHWVYMLYSAVCATVFTLFLARDSQLLLGNKITLMDYIYAGISIYVDIIFIFFSILQLGSRN
ncbi:hypothetical protein JRQ81_001903 [Phrynocephalus forsythii]|uniref:Uncharacterized protein n=1 Tax=Phrynocephalus forsythii TaxID=171643 RepID=A0A9Q0Y994_9SAUR|nr:hypothetical protein JRQ81_001903 [Phrynocephalus forsythii]